MLILCKSITHTEYVQDVSQSRLLCSISDQILAKEYEDLVGGVHACLKQNITAKCNLCTNEVTYLLGLV